MTSISQIVFSAVATAALLVSGLRVLAADESASPATPAASLGIQFIEGSTSTMILERDGRQYVVDLVAKTVTEQDPPASPKRKPDSKPKGQLDAAAIFKQRCSGCHGADAKGLRYMGTPDFTDPKSIGEPHGRANRQHY